MNIIVNLISALILALLLSACQHLPITPQSSVDFSQYYLWIKTLNEQELTAEISRQQHNQSVGNSYADMQLIMLYSLPKSPIHNPYTAKAQLNEYQLEPYNTATFNPKDLAFVVMLKDQLNQQLLILNEMNNYRSAYQQAKVVIDQQDAKINQYQQIIDQLNKKITQLKKIEQTITERGQ
ncbi:hypothetical protein [Thalassotalea sp. PLHSN55]|uniref:hypothetical protein n=1 Tax=Thalassotalea sp. PLHSN55 TaxID=3435888 RepID=UPI003F83A6E7